MNDYPLDELLDCAMIAATAAGRHALDNAHRRTEALSITRHDIKLRLDVECQAVATHKIHSRYPGAAILGEEDLPSVLDENISSRNESGLEWVIDPIDGTVNFYHGLPLWCCSVAARRDNASLVGVVYAPELEVLYAATKESTATANDEPIHVSDVSTLENSLFLTSLNQKLDTDALLGDMISRISTSVRKTRVLGTAALDICRVAHGQADAYWEPGNYIWDVAAARLIVQQAGGSSSVLHTHPEPHRISFLATNGTLHKDFKNILSKYVPNA